MNNIMDMLCSETIAEDEKISAIVSFSATGESLAAAAQWLLDRASPLDLGCDALDICGSGGDSGMIKTFNISTAAAFVLAAGGVKIAKHGNRAVSSQSGSSDVLSALGIPVCENEDDAKRQFDKSNLCFISAPAFHPALKTISPLRKKIGKPTFLNVLGPLCNPARVKRQVIGIFDEKFLLPVVQAAKILGKTHVMAVRGKDGMDEISLCADTDIFCLKSENISRETFSPKTGNVNLQDLRGGEAVENAAIICRIFSGKKNSATDIVCLNAGAGFIVAGLENDMERGFARAHDIISSGRALKKLEGMRT